MNNENNKPNNQSQSPLNTQPNLNSKTNQGNMRPPFQHKRFNKTRTIYTNKPGQNAPVTPVNQSMTASKGNVTANGHRIVLGKGARKLNQFSKPTSFGKPAFNKPSTPLARPAFNKPLHFPNYLFS